MTEGRKSGSWQLDTPDDASTAGFALTITVDAAAWFRFNAEAQQHQTAGPDTLTVRTNDPIPIDMAVGGKTVRVTSTKLDRHFKTIFFADRLKPTVTCIIAGKPVVLGLGDFSPEQWSGIAESIEARNQAAGYRLPESAGQAVAPIRTSWATTFKTPGGLFDTPRRAEQEDRLELISSWHRMTAFTRTVAFAAVALTNKTSRESIKGMQRVSVDEIADLVYCRGDKAGAPAHGQHREDILHAFEALRAGAVPLLTIDWKPVGSGRKTRWVKEYRLVIGSFVQNYGAVFQNRETGELVTADDPKHRKVAVRSKDDRRKATKEMIQESPQSAFLKAFPPDRFKLVAFVWQWNTIFAEDMICPQVALDEKNRPRRMLKGGRHHAGNRFVTLSMDYFKVQKSFREAGLTYAPRLLDFIVSEFKPGMRRVGGSVLVEVAADKVIKYVGAWDQYEQRRTRTIQDIMAPAIEALIREEVILSGSDVMPRTDRNPDRRKAPFYRWRVTEKWTTVQAIPQEEVGAVEDAIDAAAEDDVASQAATDSGDRADQTGTGRRQRGPAKDDQPHLPGMDAPPADPLLTGDAIRSARTAARLTLRGWTRAIAADLPSGIKAPAVASWHRIEEGISGDRALRRLAPEVVAKVREMVARHRPKETS